MIKNYLKTAIRSLKKNKGFTFINLLGLALGVTVCLLIVLYVVDELSYDRFNTNADRIFRVNNEIKFGGNTNAYAVAPAPAAAALKSDFPEIEQTVRLRQRGGFQVKKGSQNIQEHGMVYADPSLFKVFTLPLIHGNANTALTEPHAIVITESIAKKYFDKINVVGQSMIFNDSLPYKVTGVIKDIPKQSHFRFDFFISMTSLSESKENAWFSNNFNTYILLKPGTDAKKLEGKFREFVRKHTGPQLESILHLTYDKFEQSGNYFKLNLTPLNDIHLKSNQVGDLSANGSIQYVYIFSAIAVFILLIACVNFMNLSTARSANRAREVGMRKVLGSPRKYLIAQFLTESIIITFIATVIAVVVAWASLSMFNQLSGKELAITGQTLSWLLPAMLVFIVVVGSLAGSYPALFLSAFQPIEVLKGKLSAGFKGSALRSFLVVFQFAISIFLIIGTVVIYNQLNYIQSKDLGYNREHVLSIHNVWALGSAVKPLKEEIKQLSGVENATLTGYLPTSSEANSTTMFKDPVIDQKRAVLSQVWSVDDDYVGTLGIKMAAGRNFSKDMPTDSLGIIINEAAAKKLGFANPIGQPLYAPQDNLVRSIKRYQIIGVIKDFNYRSLRDNIEPLILFREENHGILTIRLKTNNIPSLLSQIESKWKQVAPNRQFTYSFMDEDFDALYRSEQRIGKIAIVFTSLAIVIACLGLFGLAAYAAEQRTKEIGIRKVLGANVSAIVSMLSKDFIRLVLIAIIIASPLAWFAMQKWLQGFAYRQNFQWWVVALAGAGAILIAFVTISFQSIKAALINPVKSLRSE